MLTTFLNKYNKIGCIGRADTLDKEDFIVLYAIGQIIAYMDKEMLSGNADGSDNAFAQGINSICPASLTLFLPDKSHNFGFVDAENIILIDKNLPEWNDLAEAHHPKYKKMRPYIKKLFRRNAGIAIHSEAIIAFPNKDKAGWGGTGHTIRMAKALGKEVLVIDYENIYEIKNEIIFLLKKFV